MTDKEYVNIQSRGAGKKMKRKGIERQRNEMERKVKCIGRGKTRTRVGTEKKINTQDRKEKWKHREWK